LSLRRADEIIAVSDFTRDEIIKYYKINPNKIHSIHNGEAGEIFFSGKIKEEKQILEKRGIIKPFLFYVGTHQPRKDIPTLIQAFLELKAKYPEKTKIKGLQLVIGGKIKAHNYDLQIDSLLKKASGNSIKKEFLKDLIFTGYLNDKELVAVHRAAEIFVFPSLYEGFGLPLIEAMVSKTPVISSDIKCSREIAGKGAKFYKPKDPMSLQKALFEVIMSSNIKDDMIEAGLKNAKKYSWKITAEKTLRLFLGKNNI
jgi:glycosyltransferase involved in cell wall biosynthesis